MYLGWHWMKLWEIRERVERIWNGTETIRDICGNNLETERNIGSKMMELVRIWDQITCQLLLSIVTTHIFQELRYRNWSERNKFEWIGCEPQYSLIWNWIYYGSGIEPRIELRWCNCQKYWIELKMIWDATGKNPGLYSYLTGWNLKYINSDRHWLQGRFTFLK